MLKFVLIKILTLAKPFGISTSISLNSLINGGKTRIKIVITITEITDNTKNKDKDRGILNPFCILLDILHTIFEITKEHIIRSKKSLKIQIIKDAIKTTANLKYNELLNLDNILLLLRIS